ncbi:MAG: deoxyribonuclease V [Candidatus Poribacteria bacterium]
MRVKQLHPWRVTPAEARKIQQQLRQRVIMEDVFDEIHTVAGVDIGIKKDKEKGEIAKAAVVILSYPQLELIDQIRVEQPLGFPYIPGLLSFRESPSIIAAFEQLSTEPDLIIADGQGIAHPRRFGIASHLGLILDKPTIGCAKSRLYGRHSQPDMTAGSYAYLYDKEDIIGAAVRTRKNVNFVYISVGHKISLQSAIQYTLKCCRNYRLPQPTRLAHQVAGGMNLMKPGEVQSVKKEGPRQLSLF